MITLHRIGGNCYNKWSRTQKIASSAFHTKVFTDWKEFPKSMEFVLKYDEQATEKILNVLNKTSVNELERYNISKGRTLKIAKYRETEGPFKTIEQVLEVDDFGAKILEKLVISIAEGGSDKTAASQHKPVSKILNSLTQPPLTHGKRSAIDTVTAIHVARPHVSWAKIKASGRLLTWDSYSDFEFPKKDNPMLLLDVALKLRKKLPASDAYVIEAPSTSQGPTTGQMSATVLKMQCLQLTTMLVTLLATRFNHLNENDAENFTPIDNCYHLRRYAAARLFRLVVGNEIVSASKVVNQILDNTFTESFKDIPRITIDGLEVNVYDRSDLMKKEALSQALLLSIAFMDLAVKCNPLSLKVLESKRPMQQY